MDITTLSPLGKQSSYIAHYQRDLLFPIPREIKRKEINVPSVLPFKGCDVWNAYEISWLNPKGKPMVVIGEFVFPCESPNLIESKSFKLYLNSFNNTKFDSLQEVTSTLRHDLSESAGAPVKVRLIPVEKFIQREIQTLSGYCLDHLDIECDTYIVDSSFLFTGEETVSEILFSDLLKSNCLVTGQPDWGSVQINYTGKQINREGLLKYIVSFRNHNEFHEQCVERIFMDIMTRCKPDMLSVQARYTRRGGLDINPYRSTEENSLPPNVRLSRQ